MKAKIDFAKSITKGNDYEPISIQESTVTIIGDDGIEIGLSKSYFEDPVLKSNPFEYEQPQNDNGDLVPLVWMIDKLRKREGGCTMNEIVAEVNRNFEGIEQIKHRTINYR